MRENILFKYRSHVTHSLIFLCRDSEQAEQLTTASASEFLSVAVSKNGMWMNGPEIVLRGAVLALNTMKDSNAILDNIRWTTFIVPLDTQSTINTVAVDGEMTIKEIKTFNFYKLFNEAVGLLQTDPQSVIWVIKNIFIGYTDSNTIEYEADTTPYMFWLVDSTAKYTKEFSEYNMKFVGLSNGVAKSAQFHVQSGEFVIKPDKVKNLSVALGYLAEYLNDLYQDNRAEQIKLNPSYADYKQVKYEILTDERYGDSKYKLDEWDINDRGYSDVSTGSIFHHTGNIEIMIHEIMKLSSQVKKDAQNSDNKFTTYKIVSSTVFNDNDVIVRFKVVPFDTPTVSNLLDKGSQESAAAAVQQQTDHYVFNYLHTGKNIDVLNFDINVNYGLVLMQNLHNSVPIQSSISQSDEQNMAMHDGFGKHTKKPILTPTMMPSITDDRNKVFHDTQLTYQQALAKHAFVEGLESKIKIMGNPDLMGRFNTSPGTLISDTPDWAKKFVLCKINVAVPTSTDHPGSFNYQEPFWYDGYYAILSVEQIIEGNLFTQEIELMSIPEVTNISKKDGQPDE